MSKGKKDIASFSGIIQTGEFSGKNFTLIIPEDWAKASISIEGTDMSHTVYELNINIKAGEVPLIDLRCLLEKVLMPDA